MTQEPSGQLTVEILGTRKKHTFMAPTRLPQGVMGLYTEGQLEQAKRDARNQALEDAAKTLRNVDALHEAGLVDVTIDAIRNIKEQTKRKPIFTTGHCKEKAKAGGCQLNNFKCKYPACDRKLT